MAFPGCIGARRRVASSRPSTPRCATAARASTSALTVTSSRPRSRTPGEPLITAVQVAPASEQDGPQAKHLIDAQPQHRRPAAGARATPPTAPGRSAPSSLSATSRSWRRWRRGWSSPAGWARRDFQIDPAAGTVSCPAGQIATIRTQPKGARQRVVRQARLRSLPATRSLRRSASDARLISLAPDEELLIAARQALAEPDTAEHLRRTRPRIERLLGLLAARYGARKSRYFGTAKARLQAAWAAALVNLNPISRHLAGQTA